MLLKYWHDNYTNKGRKKFVSFVNILMIPQLDIFDELSNQV